MALRPDESNAAPGGEWSRSSERRQGRTRPTSSGQSDRSRTVASTAVFGTEATDAADTSESNRTTPAPRTGGLSLKGRALAHLARREHSRAELTRKLAPHAESPEAVERALDELTQRGFLSDARVVETHVYHRAAKLGAARIRVELEQKGIASDLVAPALSALQETEAERAWALWQSRFGALSEQEPVIAASETTGDHESLGREERRLQQVRLRLADQRDRARQQRFLLSRGFSASVVNATLRRAGRSEEAVNEGGDASD